MRPILFLLTLLLSGCDSITTLLTVEPPEPKPAGINDMQPMDANLNPRRVYEFCYQGFVYGLVDAGNGSWGFPVTSLSTGKHKTCSHGRGETK